MSNRLPLAIAAVLVFALAACSSDPAQQTSVAPTTTSVSTTTAAPTPSSTTTTTAAPAERSVEVPTDLGAVQVIGTPERIAALSSVYVEMLFAIGAGDQVVAGDLFSNHPDEAQSLIQLDSFNLNLEAIIALDPDLVVLSFDPGDVVAGLNAVGIPTLLYGTAKTLQQAYDQMLALGLATGHEGVADELVASIDSAIADVVAGVGGAAAGLTYYHESDPFTFYTANSSSFIGQLYGLLGMVNIADAAPDEFGSGFPQLSPEFIVAADPDLIFLASFGEDLDTVRAREGWDSMTAVAEGNVVLLDPDVASRWGPRVEDLMRAIGDGVLEHLES